MKRKPAEGKTLYEIFTGEKPPARCEQLSKPGEPGRAETKPTALDKTGLLSKGSHTQ
jgi:hypothetical protein